MRNILFAATLFGLIVSTSCAEDTPDLTTIDRTIAREPRYQDKPHYALLVFGPNAEHRSWLVVDGESVAYIDRNGNGDLTEPGERVNLDVKATNNIKLGNSSAYRAMNVFPLGKVEGMELNFHLWIRNPDFDTAQDDLYRETFREWDEKKWMNGSLMRITANGAQAQNPLLLTSSADEAQIAHLDGPLTFELKWGDRQRLEPWPKETVFDIHIGTPNLLAMNCSHRGFGFSRLTTSEVPPAIRPIARFEIPAASGDSEPIIKELTLDERCCGDTFYARFTLPHEIEAEKVKVTVSCPAWSDHPVRSAVFHVPINRELAPRAERTFVLFHDPKITINDAVNVLRRRGLDVEINSEQLLIREGGKPAFGITLLRSMEVLDTSVRLARGTKYADQLGICDARFEISFVDIEQIQHESKTLIAIRSALEELTNGIVYNTWDKPLVKAK